MQYHFAVSPELSPSAKRVHSAERPRCLLCDRLVTTLYRMETALHLLALAWVTSAHPQF